MITRECVHLVIGSYFRSRDKDGDHTLRSVVAENPMLQVHFTALYVVQTQSYWRRNFHTAGSWICAGMQVSIARILDVCRPFLLLWPWPRPDNLHIRTWPVFPEDTPDVQIWTSYVKAFESYRLTDIVIDRQNRPKLKTTPLRGWWKIVKQRRGSI